MSLTVLANLIATTLTLLLLETWRRPGALGLSIKGDIKRESWWLQQYGQAVCTPVAALLIWELDPIDSGKKAVITIAAVAITSLVCALLKRLFGRIRPGRENAGRFLGPSFALRGESSRQSFPSSHTACAVALTAVLTAFYPHGWTTFWFLAISCSALRYLLDAHWPSDIVAGAAAGYAVAHAVMVSAAPIFDAVYPAIAHHL